MKPGDVITLGEDREMKILVRDDGELMIVANINGKWIRFKEYKGTDYPYPPVPESTGPESES